MGRKRVVRRVVHRRGKGRGISLPSRRLTQSEKKKSTAVKKSGPSKKPERPLVKVRKLTEAEIATRALGTTPITQSGIPTVHPAVWERYKHKYPSEPRWVPDDTDVEIAWDPVKKMIVFKNVKTGVTVPFGIPDEEILRSEDPARAYAEKLANSERERAEGGRFLDVRVVKGKEGYKFEYLRLPQQQFLEDVRAGKVKERGLKLSEMQVRGLPPESGYLQAVLGPELPHPKEHYRVGLVVKITGDYDKDLEDAHNTWAVITKVIDPWHYEVVQENTGKKFIIRDTDVKAWIGDLEHDYIGIGKERHEKEVVPLIRKALRGKIPVAEHLTLPIPGGPLGAARRLAEDPKMFEIEKRKAIEALKEIKANRKRYEKEDYERLLKEAEEWVKAFEQVEKELKLYGRDWVVARGRASD